MTITIHAQGAERKRLVKTISDWLGVPAKYCGAPTFNYEVDYFTIDRNGSLSFDDRADSEVIERLLQHIYDEGFDIDQSNADDEDEPCAVCISMPRSLFTDSDLENLKALIAAKGSLIKKALGVADLPLEITDTKVSFQWFPATPTPDEMNAYDTFICKLCEMARNQSRVNSSEKPIENEKYAFRCFLLRLGFIGDEYKAARKILLKNLSGSSAFRNGGAGHEIDPFPIWWTRKSEKKLNEFMIIPRPVQAATEAQRRASKRSGGIHPRAECGRTVL